MEVDQLKAVGRLADLAGSAVEFWRSGVEVVELGRKYHRWPPDFDSPFQEYRCASHQLIQKHMRLNSVCEFKEMP